MSSGSKADIHTDEARSGLDYADLMDDELREYYLEKKDFIEESIEEFMPKVITSEKLEQVAGIPPFAWDIETLQKSFFEPLRRYVDEGPGYACSIFLLAAMESFGCDPRRYLLMVSVPEYFNISTLVFEELVYEKDQRWQRPTLLQLYDFNIVGNLIYAIPTLTSYPSIYNLVGLDDMTRLRVYEVYNCSSFKTAVGLGAMLALRDPDCRLISEDEYVQCCMDGGSLNFPASIELSGVLGKAPIEEIDPLLEWAGYASAWCKLERDLTFAMRFDEKGEPNPKIWGKESYLVVAALNRASKTDADRLHQLVNLQSKSQADNQEIMELLYRYDAPQITRSRSEELFTLAGKSLEDSSIPPEYQRLYACCGRLLKRVLSDERF